MKIYLDKKYVSPCCIHAAGKIDYNNIWSDLYNYPIKKIPPINQSIDIITWNQKIPKNHYKNYKNLGLFESCCDRLGVNYTILSDNTKIWTNRLKIPTTFNFLNTCKKDFIFAADSSDVFAFDIPKISIFDVLQCDAIFNAEIKFWPPEFYDLKHKEDSLVQRQFRYLNSGLWFAKTSFARELFKELNYLYEINFMPEFVKSDQVLFKYLYTKYFPKIKIDSDCNIFLNSSHVFCSLKEKNNFQTKFV